MLTAVNLGIKYLLGQLLAIENKPICLSIIYTEADIYVEKELTQELINFFGIKSEDMKVNSQWDDYSHTDCSDDSLVSEDSQRRYKRLMIVRF